MKERMPNWILERLEEDLGSAMLGVEKKKTKGRNSYKARREKRAGRKGRSRKDSRETYALNIGLILKGRGFRGGDSEGAQGRNSRLFS